MQPNLNICPDPQLDMPLFLLCQAISYGLVMVEHDYKQFLEIKDEDQCMESLGESATPPNDGYVYCNATFDSLLCWAPTRAGEIASLNCPSLYSLDVTKHATRRCGDQGIWDGHYPGDTSMGSRGWTNFDKCFIPQAKVLVERYLGNKTEEELEAMRSALRGTRTLDMVGLVVSLIAVVISLLIFSYFRSLRCHRTRIHRNLFVAIGIQVLLRLIYYIDQQVARATGGEVAGSAARSHGFIFHAPIMCEIHLSLLEYSHTVMFMWMFIEGLYLHNVVAVSVFSGKPNYKLYYGVAWGFPLPSIIGWVIAMSTSNTQRCWELYYYVPYIWIIEAPRVTVLVVNLFFYCNIIRILISKLRNSYSNEEQQVKKAVKAAVILLPLLGMTNFLVMMEPPTSTEGFGAWSYISHFLVSFQGLFISVAYCYLNGEVHDTVGRSLNLRVASRKLCRKDTMTNELPEVQRTLRKRWERYWQHRSAHSNSKRRLSRSLSIFTSITEVSHGSSSQQNKSRTPSTGNGVPLLTDLVAIRESSTCI